MEIKELEELRGKLTDRQEKVAKAFEQAKATTDDGTETYDLSQVKVFGEGMSSIAVAEKIRQFNDEMNDLGQQIDNLEGAKQAGEGLNQPKSGMRHPGAPSNPGGNIEVPKSLGERVTGAKNYAEWEKNGRPNGITVSLSDMLPSDAFAKSAIPETLQTKTLMQTSAGWAPESLRIGGFVEAVTRPIQLLDIVPLQQTSYEQVVYMQETTRTHNAAEIAEAAAYPEDAFALTEQTSSVRKIATSLPVTDEQLEDVAQVQGYINSRLTFGLRQRLDSQVLVGDGTSPNLEGIKNVTGINSQAKGTDPIPDAIFKAMRKIRVTGRAQPTHVVMHSTDWEKVRLMRTSEGQYIWGNPSEAGPERIWGLPVVQSEADAAGNAYVGSFQSQWVSLFERRGIDVQVGYVGTQFTEGKRTVRGDMRTAFVVFRPAAFTHVTGL